jgi:aspartyl-tRNA(Asn)/glutamyl-tRNA(Gln) amidotransferase subunit A
MKNLIHLSASELKEGFIKGEFSAEEIVRFYLKRIEKLDPKIGAFLHTMPEKSLERAKELDKKRADKKPLGKLAGIPIAIKDNIHIKGEKTTCASKILHNYKAVFSSTACRLMEEEDAIFIGKTNLDEFAMGSSNENSAFFPCKNPWNLDCSPGGSSGGSAASVAARIAPLAFGSDTGGSIRQPAAFCGIAGFKPTYGRISRYGLVAFGSSLDQIGPLATTTEDCALAMEVLGRHCLHDSTSLNLPPESIISHFGKDLKGVKIGIPWHFLQNISPAAHKNFSEAMSILKSLGAELIDIDLSILKYSIAVYYILASAEASTNLARFDGIRYGHRSKEAKSLDEIYDFSRREGFGKEVKKRIMLGTFVLSSGFKDAYYRKAQKVRSLMIKAFNDVFAKCDAVAIPTSPSPAFHRGSVHDPIEMYLMDIFTIPASLAGLPAISVPSGFDGESRPLSLQLIGPQLHDAKVLKYANAYEKATGFGKIIPPLFNGETA